MRLDNITFTQKQLIAALTALKVDVDNLTGAALSMHDITLDSRTVSHKHVFVALKGTLADGHGYIDDAIAKGSRLILCEALPETSILSRAASHDCSVLRIQNLKSQLPTLLTNLFAHDNAIKITAVTGTNGKTSVAALNAQLALHENLKSACLGTLGLNIYTLEQQKIALKNVPVGENTTPDIISHYKVLSMLEKLDINDYCLEASSHGIEQKRLAGLPIDTVVFTNLTQDHLDYHGTLAAYGLAKRGLLTFETLRHVVLNADDPESRNWQANAPANASIAWYSLDAANIPEGAAHFCVATELHCTPSGIDFTLTSSWGNATIHSPLFGEFNVANLMSAVCVRLLKGANFKSLVRQISKVNGVPGRMELFVNNTENANIIVDYAHTPDALEKALIAARLHTNGKLYCVFGCGGNRDKTKRPVMGSAADKFSDVVVLTQDNTRNESAMQIIQDIQTGISSTAKVHIELDRKSAIRWAWHNSQKQDLILVAGKGHEDYLEINNQRLLYNEREFVQQLSAEAVA